MKPQMTVGCSGAGETSTSRAQGGGRGSQERFQLLPLSWALSGFVPNKIKHPPVLLRSKLQAQAPSTHRACGYRAE